MRFIKKTNFVLLGLFVGLSQFSIRSQIIPDSTLLKEVVVTDTRIERALDRSGKSVRVISNEMIESAGSKTLADLLNQVAGIHIDGNFGSPGTNLSLFIRGGRNHHSLILIDGIPITDPSGINMSYDLRNVSLNQVESIEILNGGMSTLYGTGAAAGVVNIRLKKNSEEGVNGSVRLDAGSYGRFGQRGEIQANYEKLNYLVSIGNLNIRGFSAATDPEDSGEFDDDGFDQKNVLLRTGYQFNADFSLEGLLSFDKFTAEYDDNVFTDAENMQVSDQWRFGLTPKFTYSTGEIKLAAFLSLNEKEFESSFPQEYAGKSIFIDVSHKHEISSKISVLSGIQFQALEYEELTLTPSQTSQFTLLDPFITLNYQSNGFSLNSGVRINSHSEYDPELVYNLNPAYRFSLNSNLDFKLFGSLSSSYITPSLYQFYSIYGNTQLLPERSLNSEIGLSAYIGRESFISATLFQRDEKDPLDFESLFDDLGNFIGGRYINVEEERHIKGLEIESYLKILPKLAFNLNYSLITSDNLESLQRIPKHKLGSGVSFRVSEDCNFGFNYLYTSKRTTFDFVSFSEVSLESFGLLDFVLQYKWLNQKLVSNLAINNLTNKEFTGVYGYNSRGINYNIGVTYNFGRNE